jgi:hypothetical protein
VYVSTRRNPSTECDVTTVGIQGLSCLYNSSFGSWLTSVYFTGSIVGNCCCVSLAFGSSVTLPSCSAGSISALLGSKSPSWSGSVARRSGLCDFADCRQESNLLIREFGITGCSKFQVKKRDCCSFTSAGESARRDIPTRRSLSFVSLLFKVLYSTSFFAPVQRRLIKLWFASVAFALVFRFPFLCSRQRHSGLNFLDSPRRCCCCCCFCSPHCYTTV